jgi:pimeloyl-ACP methyl ester carboxylesterase
LPFAAREALAYAAKGVLLPWAALGARRPDGHGMGLVLIHGYGSGRGAFVPLVRRLRAAGYERIAAFGYTTFGHTFEDLLDDLDAYLRHTLPAGPLAFVGHSIGGVLARAYLQRGGETLARSRALVTLSTPHAGLPVARLLEPIPVIRELAPGSPLLRRLSDQDRALEALPCLSIVSSRDHFVRSPHEAAFARTTPEVVEHVGHVGVLFDGQTLDRVVTFLRTHAPSQAEEGASS